jgi:hypothetical protein
MPTMKLSKTTVPSHQNRWNYGAIILYLNLALSKFLHKKKFLQLELDICNIIEATVCEINKSDITCFADFYIAVCLG